MSCKKKRTPEQALFEVFDTLNIETHKKTVLQERYLQVMDNFHIRARRLSFAFYISRVIVTVGSILVPAFLSIQASPTDRSFYWTTWVISLAVTISNGFITLFKLDKKYYFINTTLEMLHSEGWQYIGLTGKYSAKNDLITATHDNQFQVFFRMAEKIKMRQVEEEYWKFTDTAGVGNATTHHPLLTSASPVTQQGELASLSIDKKTLIESWLEDMKKHQAVGLQPRTQSSTSRILPRLSITRIDEGSSPSRVPRTPSGIPLPMQSNMPVNPTLGETVLRGTQESEGEQYEDALVEITMSNEPNIGQ
jgi:hypothetical protein